ncbi:MAG: Nif11-like leader peptide family natural product precursor [Syntrophomonadaceae bacterium]|jgi:predicted ribosomally synthesized peptide with nif11-like leader|nr:Nif11-like leader peptide family natural product precursor [Syntrophomonadaceae bacterium]MDD3270605.1 Nif11-like leader peptide family natural product precursor [Syntrophomonadaceae bacterium]MDD3897849.1 Nif11-like leader peptide family natural product precursor [Syntrophomonadaceae bacterium]MDD4561785.1 Nif11-like leader peptide family natural product precursor [Syntrophomonadaceae bacterium]
MSIESAKAFVEKIKSDEEFAKKVQGCKDKEERIAFAKQAGFDFTAEEIKEVSSKLSDDELDAVAGGSLMCHLIAI